MKKTPLIITIDGPAGSGKSTVAKRLALHFRIPCLDTGAMYRCVALQCLHSGIDLNDELAVTAQANPLEFMFGVDDSGLWTDVIEDGQRRRLGAEIRTPEVSMAASSIAKIASLRAVMVEKQQKLGKTEGAVVEGRDAGTVIFPEAPYKFYVTASPEERARRRFLELQGRDSTQTMEAVLADVIQRDKQDLERTASPLKPAPDAIVIDTTGLSLEAVLLKLMSLIQK